jgi:hypothetical protein
MESEGTAPETDASEQQHGDGDNAAGDVVQGDKNVTEQPSEQSDESSDNE